MDAFNGKNYFSVPEASEILGVSRGTVFNWIKKGTVKAEKVGRNFAISHDELIKHLDKRPLSEEEREQIRQTVDRAIKQYGETLRRLSRE